MRDHSTLVRSVLNPDIRGSYDDLQANTVCIPSESNFGSLATVSTTPYRASLSSSEVDSLEREDSS